MSFSELLLSTEELFIILNSISFSEDFFAKTR